MKYLILVYSNPANWEHPTFLHHEDYLALPAGERADVDRRAGELQQEIETSGELLVGTALADPALSRTLRVRDGVPAVTDGPYLESKEQLAGYFVVDCDTPERAYEIASRFPDVRFGAVEVRPIMGSSGQEM